METAALRFTIRNPQGRTQELTVDADIARIGSGAHCEIRLPAEDAAVEQLLVKARSGGVFGEARSMEPPMLMNGAPFVQGRLLPDSTLKLGTVELTVSLVERRLAAGSSGRTSSTSGKVLYAVALLAISVTLVLLIARARTPRSAVSMDPPPLWSKDSVAQCAQSERGSAAALADKYRLQAEAARERAPFSPQDGVQAVESFAEAAACYSAAQADAAAEQSRLALETLKQQLSREYHVHSVRLERALATQRYDQARTEVRILLSFGPHRSEPYFSWLSTLDRQIELKFSGKKS